LGLSSMCSVRRLDVPSPPLENSMVVFRLFLLWTDVASSAVAQVESWIYVREFQHLSFLMSGELRFVPPRGPLPVAPSRVIVSARVGSFDAFPPCDSCSFFESIAWSRDYSILHVCIRLTYPGSELAFSLLSVRSPPSRQNIQPFPARWVFDPLPLMMSSQNEIVSWLLPPR